MTDGITVDQRKKLARIIVVNCIGIFLVALVFGSYILNFFGLNIAIIRVGGGLLLAFIFTLAVHHIAGEDIYVQISGLSGTFIGLVGVAIVVYLCYVYSYVIEKKLGPDSAHALNRMMAFVTLCIGLQILWAGIQGLAKTLA